MNTYSYADYLTEPGVITKEEALEEIPIEFLDKLSPDLIQLYVLGRTGGDSSNRTTIFNSNNSEFSNFEEFLNMSTISNYYSTERYITFTQIHDFYISDFTGIEYFKNLTTISLVLDEIEDLDFSYFEAMDPPKSRIYDVTTGNYSEGNSMSNTLNITYFSKIYRPLHYSSNANKYNEKREKIFFNNYSNLVGILSNLDFDLNSKVVLSPSEFGTLVPVLSYAEEFMRINDPYLDGHSTDKLLNIKLFQQSVDLTQTINIDEYDNDSYIVTIVMPEMKGEEFDASYGGSLFTIPQVNFTKMIVDGVDITDTFGYILQPFERMELIITKDAYKDFMNMYEKMVDINSISNPYDFLLGRSAYHLISVSGWNGIYNALTVKFIPPRDKLNVFYLLGKVDLNEKITPIGTLPEGTVPSYSSYYTREETGNIPTLIPDLKLDRPGYTLLGWYDSVNQKMWDFETDQATEELFLEAIWVPDDKIEEYFVTITFEPLNGEPSSNTKIFKGAKVSIPDNPSLDNHSFKQWVLESSVWDFDAAVNTSITLQAEWISNLVTVRFVDKPVTTEIKLPHNGTLTHGQLPSLNYPEKVFKGWNYNEDGTGDWYDINDVIQEDITVYSIYEDLVSPVLTRTVTFIDGEFNYSITLPSNSKMPEESVPIRAKEGYQFEGWNESQDATAQWLDLHEAVMNDITVYAIYAKIIPLAQNYILTFIDQDSVKTVPVTHDTVISPENIPSAERDGFDFVGWNFDQSGSGDWFNPTIAIDQDMILYAIYIKQTVSDRYITVSFIDQDLKTDVQVLVNTVIPIEKFPKVSKLENRFLGWNYKFNGSGVFFDSDSVVSEDLTLYAIYETMIPPTIDNILPVTGVGSQHQILYGLIINLSGLIFIRYRVKKVQKNY